jgi:tRNA (cmo5U34)-methyltransferase
MQKTTHSASDYDQGVLRTIPFYQELHGQVEDLVAHSGVAAGRWLDSGCGTGTFVERCLEAFPGTRFELADPSADMLARARERLAEHPRAAAFHPAGAESLALPDASFDVITAVLSHHYFAYGERLAAAANCFRMLAPGGIFVEIAHTAAAGDRGRAVALDRWRDFQVRSGKAPEKADAHIACYDTEYFPLTPFRHLDMLGKAGFSAAEIFWYSYSQMGVYAIKEAPL